MRSSFIILLLSFASALCADWPMFRGNPERTGASAEPAGIPAGSPAWVASLGSPIASSPAIVDSRLFIGCRDSCVYSIDAATGKVLWRTKTNGWVESSPLAHEGRIYVGSLDGFLYVLDAVRGAVMGRYSAGAHMASPGIVGRSQLVSGLGPPFSSIGFFDVGRGFGGPAWQVPSAQISYSSAAVAGDVATIGANDGRLYAVNAASRHVLWSVQTGGGVYLSTPAISGGTAYFAPGEFDRRLYAISLSNGTIVWSAEGALDVGLAKKLGGGAGGFDARALGSMVRFRPAYRARLFAELVEAAGAKDDGPLGRPKRIRGTAAEFAGEFIPTGAVKTSSVCVDSARVYVVQKELGYAVTADAAAPYPEYRPRFTVRAVDKFDGHEVWRASDVCPGDLSPYASSPVVAGGKLFVGWGMGKFCALDAASGARRWSTALRGGIVSSPALAGGKLFVATLAGYVYAFATGVAAPGAQRPQLKGSLRGGMRLQFGLAQPGRVVIRIFLTNGRVARTIADEAMDQGVHTVPLFGSAGSERSVGAGTYLLQVSIGGMSTVLLLPVLK